MAACLLLLTLPACIDRTRLNATCDWTSDLARTLDLAAPADRRHLVADAQLAEGLAVRYADTEHRRRFGYGGHGGLIDHGRLLHECFATLASRIERDHGVTAGQIDEARGVRDPRFDLPVALVFVGLYAFASARIARWIRRRFFDTDRVAGALVAAAASPAVGAMGVQLLAVWSAIWETVRIGDDHFGTFRAAHPPWAAHPGMLLSAGMLLFVIVAVGVVLPARTDEPPDALTHSG